MAHGECHASCSSLFGCGESGPGLRGGEDLAAHLLDRRARDRLPRLGVSGEAMDELLTARGRERRSLLRGGGVLGAMVAAGPLFTAACTSPRAQATPAGGGPAAGAMPAGFGAPDPAAGRVHVVPSNPQTVRLGVFDTTLPLVAEVESGDVVSYPNTWTHFLDRMQPGVPVEQLAQWRRENPGKGPHSIIGPVGVRGARPGDALEIRYLRVRPRPWAANFNNPGALGTGALADLFPEGQVRYLDLDLSRMTTRFADGIELPLQPFQGTLGVAPPAGWLGSTTGVVSSVPPGPHGGNVDLRELAEGTRLYLPVWQPGAKIFTGDSHALQGDGEVNLTALETAMEELRIQVVLHPGAGLEWPFAETATHWIALGMDKSLDTAFRIALVNAIDFLSRRAGLSRLDAYALCSLGVSFRITQVVDVNKGVHAMIPKAIFDPALRDRVKVA
ncbi:MAG TPA: acetamidase/formamidase family protein [Anaeromyxobacteraceae bacterium]|nr:acetamidase/formamidase family protein [Anaeromyxobacteraceae bacterium]